MNICARNALELGTATMRYEADVTQRPVRGAVDGVGKKMHKVAISAQRWTFLD